MLCYTPTVKMRKVRTSFESHYSPLLVKNCVVYCSEASAGSKGANGGGDESSEHSQQDMSQVSVPAIECHS